MQRPSRNTQLAHRGALADALARLILHSDDVSESAAGVEMRASGGSEYSKGERKSTLRAMAAREMMNALSRLAPGTY